MDNKNIDLYFQKDSVYYEILKCFQKSKYIQQAEEKAREFRAFITAYDKLTSDTENQCRMFFNLDGFPELSNNKRFMNSLFNLDSSYKEMTARRYFDEKMKDFCEFYASDADRFKDSELSKLHLSYSHVMDMKEYEDKPINEVEKEQENLHKFKFNDTTFNIKNYDEVRSWNVNQLFESLFHRWNALCWFRHLKYERKEYEKTNKSIYRSKLNDVNLFFNDLVIKPMEARHLRLRDLPYFYENPLGSDVSKRDARLKSQAHAFALQFVSDLVNGLLTKLPSKSYLQNEDYVELYAVEGLESIDMLGGRVLSGYLLPILDILILEEVFSVKFSVNSISEVLGIYDARKTKKYIEESRKRLKLIYLSKLASFYEQ